MDLEWSLLYPEIPSLWVLTYRSDEVARVDRLSGDRWCAEVNRHLRDERRRKRRMFETCEEAKRAAQCWTRANLERIKTQLPVMVPAGGYRRAEWPASNPEPRWFI